MRLIYEHILFPSIFMQEPTWLVYVYCDNQELGVFGFDVCSESEIGTGILCRLCGLLQVSMVNPRLHDCHGLVKENGLGNTQETVFIYNDDKFTFEHNE